MKAVSIAYDYSYVKAYPDVVLGNCYLTVSEEGHGITSKPVSKKMVAYELGFLTVENLETSLFKKVYFN